jgi:hypothetical protein
MFVQPTYSLSQTSTQNALDLSALNLSQGKSNTINDDGDYVYYNVNIINRDEPDGKIAKFSENRVVPVLQKPSDYNICCVRFQLPSINIPILFFDNYSFSVKLSYGVSTVSQVLVWIPNSVYNPYAPKQPIYDYQEVVSSLNIALAAAKTALNALQPAVIPFDAPFITYNAESSLFDLNAETAGYNGSLPNFIKIIFSADLFVLFANLQDFFLNANETQIIVQDNFNNSTVYNGKPYLFMRQSQESLELWAEINRIVILSNSIPIRQELSPTQDDVTKRILFDFNVTGRPDKGKITFFLQGPPRYSDMLSDYPMTQVDCEFVWADSEGNTFPIYLNVNDNASMKLQFVKRIDLRLNGY